MIFQGCYVKFDHIMSLAMWKIEEVDIPQKSYLFLRHKKTQETKLIFIEFFFSKCVKGAHIVFNHAYVNLKQDGILLRPHLMIIDVGEYF